MNNLKIIMLAMSILPCSSLSWADSVVITFTDGKTQSIILDGTVNTIATVKYLSSDDRTSGTPLSTVPQAHTSTLSSPHEMREIQQRQIPEKPKVKFKWADPVVGQ
ncbi:MAG: hypothetical protein PHH28_11125 [Desulfuromonadaceae bacterium]|nr:hypothetical protein [Desulfuromonadaceae bacterium]